MFTSARHAARTELLLAVLLVGSYCVYSVYASSFVIDDERVKTLDISPALGRGYSVKTNQFHSICLDVDETTEPSYNYDYSYTDVSSALSTSTNTKVSNKIQGSFGWGRVKADYESESDRSTNSKSSKQFVMTTMRIERYYASVKENKSPLSADAAMLLERKDYVGFYKACGPNYVRSIRRAQEVTAMFTFESSSSEVASNMKSKIKATAYGWFARGKTSRSKDKSSSIDSAMSSLQIQIFGFGLGLDKDGSETLVATSLEEYNAAMKFAFTSMTRGNQGSAQTGMVYGIELVPWTDNTAFQVASNLHDTAEDAVSWTVPYEMIPNANKSGACKGVGHETDDSDDKKCCKASDMKEFGTGKEEGTKKYCQPVRRFPVDLLKQNLQRNGEHVAMMDSILHYKTYTIMTLERCIQVLRTYPESEKNTYLETPDSVQPRDGGVDKSNRLVTVSDLKQFLNPDNDMASVELLNMELDEYIDMYYNPCMAALFGMNADAMGSSEPGDMLDYFMMKQWNFHPECKFASCMIPTNSWDSKSDNGGCKPSFGQSGTEEIKDVTTARKSCAKEYDRKTSSFVCKRTNQNWKDEVAKLDGCWKDSTPFVLIERYCTPRLSESVRTNPNERKITESCSKK